MKIEVFKVPQAAPDDLTAFKALVEQGALNLKEVVAVLGKTEGNGCVNDFTRGYATQTLRHFFSQHCGEAKASEIIYIMSGGTEGVLSPHLTVFVKKPSKNEDALRFGLVLGTSRTRDFLPEEIGTLGMVDAVAESVQKAINDAGLEKRDTHFVQIKCPLLSSDDVASAAKRGGMLRTQDTYESMALSRAASALGVGVALEEVDRAMLREVDIAENWNLYSQVASTSAGIEVKHCEILVLGNAAHSTSDLLVGHAVMHNALDIDAVRAAWPNGVPENGMFVSAFAKAEASPNGKILGRRHTMLQDSDINHTRMARAVVGAVIASVVRDPMIYVSGGAEHQGPPGGGPVAVIAGPG